MAPRGAIQVVSFCFQFGSAVRVLAVETFVRALCDDINRLDVARSSKKTQLVKTIEQTLSEGFVMLPKLLDGNLTVERESILTAFSLTPTDELHRKISELAERSGFVKSGPTNTELNSKEGGELLLRQVPVPANFSGLDFEQLCDQEEADLSKGFGRGRNFRTGVQEKPERNLEGLVSLQVISHSI